jgi:hypothetical protein
MADKRISQLIERTDIANNDVLPIVANGATTTNKVTISTIQDWMQDNLDVGVTSVGLSVPSAFSVSGSPVTTSGNITISGAGTTAQYIRGDGSLADFPSISGGGSSISYYLNGSVSQGTIGGVAYLEMNKVPILGAGTDFTISSDGYIASFITDAGDPSLLEIPGGNWNFETYFQASSGGGSPTFYVELYKVSSGGTATLIASNSTSPESISLGTAINPYFSVLAVPTTTLALTDRLAIRYYVVHAGRTITLHTENNTLCQIITTFTTGLTALNGLTAQVQNFATGTSGTDFNISSASTTHTFNIPSASADNRGLVTTGAQNFAGNKSFQNTIFVNAGLRLDQNGTALPTFVQNISGTGLISSGSNGLGFNSANNLYFSGSDKGGAVFSVNNSAVRTYTLQDGNGTLAFTSQIPTNPVGGTGAQGRVAYWSGSGTITSDSLFQWNDTFKRLGIGRTPTVSLDVQGAAVISNEIKLESTAGNGLRIYGSSGTNQWDMHLSGTSLRFSDNTGTGSLLFDRPLNGTSASFSGTLTLNGADNKINSGNELRFYRTDNAIYSRIFDAGTSFVFDNRNGNGFSFQSAGTNQFLIASTGAATFSSSVTATSPGNSANSIVGNYSGGSQMMQFFQKPDGSNMELNLRNSAGTAIARIDTSGNSWFNGGNVGIGTASPDSILEVIKPINTSDTIPTSGVGDSTLFSTFLQGSVQKYGLVFGVTYTSGTSWIQSRYRDITGQLPLSLQPLGGNVGIGTASPSRNLHVLGGSGVGTVLKLEGGSGATTYLQLSYNGATNAQSGYIGYDTSSNMPFFTNDTERMRITSGGVLLVGKTDPAVDTGDGIRVDTDGTLFACIANAESSYYVRDITNATYRFRVSGAGTVFATNTTISSISDERLKENIRDLDSGLDKIMLLKPRVFDWKEGSGQTGKDIKGFIAQEVEEFFPEMIDEWGNENLEEGETPYKSVRMDVIPMLVKAIQELKAEIDSLKNQMQ